MGRQPAHFNTSIQCLSPRAACCFWAEQGQMWQTLGSEQLTEITPSETGDEEGTWEGSGSLASSGFYPCWHNSHTHTHKVTSTFLPSRILNWHKCRVAILIYCTYRCDTFHSSEECFQCASVEWGNFGNTYSATSKLEVIPRVQHLLPQVLSFTCSHKLEEFSLFVQKVMEAGGFWSDILHLHRSTVRRRCSFPVH